VKIEFTVFRVVAPYSVVVVYKRFGGPCCLHLQGPPRRLYPTTTVHGAPNQKTTDLTTGTLGCWTHRRSRNRSRVESVILIVMISDVTSSAGINNVEQAL